MGVIKALLSFLSYVFHGLLCLILIALSGVAMAAGAQTLQLGMLPWTGSTLLYTLFFGVFCKRHRDAKRCRLLFLSFRADLREEIGEGLDVVVVKAVEGVEGEDVTGKAVPELFRGGVIKEGDILVEVWSD